LFIWNPGDGSDTVEGQAGFDSLVFNGANVNENVDISANGTRARLFRDVGNDLTGTDLKQVAINLAATGGGGDGQPDTTIVNATAGDDQIGVASIGTSVVVNGLSE